MHITGFITAIVFGAIVGVLGRLVVPGRQHIGVLLTIVIGIVAALLGTLVAGLLGVNKTSGIDWIEIMIQIVFAAIGVALVAGLMNRRATRA
jgi:uncharacterized membrane protein YeaQ/YmgE (transglycosylase-associated protein family)